MSVPESREQGESRSSVKLTRNAKGGTQPEVKVYAAGDTPEAFELAKQQAIQAYNELTAMYGSAA